MTCPQCGTLNENERELCIRCKTALHPPEMKGKIACVNHGNREATTSCGSCGQRLCSSCAANAGGIDFCDACAPAGAVRVPYDEDYIRIPVVDVATTPKASFGNRFLAAAIDLAILFAGGVLLTLLMWLATQTLDFLTSPTRVPALYYFFRVLIAAGIAAYFILLTAMNGQTFGKQLAGVIVLQPTGSVITLRTSVIRFLVSCLSLLPFGLGFWWMLWDPNQETWHDKVAETAVYPWEGA